MSLGFQKQEAISSKPYVQYNAKAGRWFKADRVQGPNGWETIKTDITANATFVIDIRGIQVGWVLFGDNGPNYALSPVGQKQPDRPSAKHRQGFLTQLYSERNLDGCREWSHNAQCVLTAIDKLHDAYTAAPEAAQGLLPVITMTGSMPITTKGKDAQGNPVSSTNFEPVFSIMQWVPSPFEAAPAAQQGAQSQQQAPAYVAPQASQNVTNGAAPLF